MSLPTFSIFEQCNSTLLGPSNSSSLSVNTNFPAYATTVNTTTAAFAHNQFENATCSMAFPDAGEWMNPLMGVIGLINFTLNLVAMIVLIRICRVSKRVQMIHHILLFLSLIEAANMFFYTVKDIMFRLGFFIRPQDNFSSLGGLYVKFYATFIIQICSTWFTSAKNWWLTSIAVARAVTIVKILTRPSPNINEGVTKATKLRINLSFALILLLTLSAGFLFHFLVGQGVRLVVCKVKNGYILDKITVNSKKEDIAALILTHEIFLVIAPLILMIASNLTICVALRLIARSASTSEGSQRLLIFTRVTRTVFVIVTVYILTEVPFTVFQLLENRYPGRPCIAYAIHIGGKVADFLVGINASCNIVIYYYWEKVFQDYVKNCCYSDCCARAVEGDKELRHPLRPTKNKNAVDTPL